MSRFIPKPGTKEGNARHKKSENVLEQRKSVLTFLSFRQRKNKRTKYAKCISKFQIPNWYEQIFPYVQCVFRLS